MSHAPETTRLFVVEERFRGFRLAFSVFMTSIVVIARFLLLFLQTHCFQTGNRHFTRALRGKSPTSSETKDFKKVCRFFSSSTSILFSLFNICSTEERSIAFFEVCASLLFIFNHFRSSSAMEIEGDRVQVVVEDRNGPKPPSGGEPEDNCLLFAPF